VTAKKPPLGSGQRFKEGAEKLIEKGYDKEKADAIMAEAGRKKYGNEKMQEMAAKGKAKK